MIHPSLAAGLAVDAPADTQLRGAIERVLMTREDQIGADLDLSALAGVYQRLTGWQPGRGYRPYHAAGCPARTQLNGEPPCTCGILDAPLWEPADRPPSTPVGKPVGGGPLAGLVAFLNARLDEDEREIRNDPPAGMGYAALPARMLRELAVRRNIVRRCANVMNEMDNHPDGLVSPRAVLARRTLAELAAIYLDHPDYRAGEWPPELATQF